MGDVPVKTGKAYSIPGGMGIGWLAGAIITLALSALLAILLLNGVIAWQNAGYYVMGIIMTATFMQANIACNAVKRRKLLMCTCSGVLYLATMLLTTALLFDGQYQSVGVTALLIVAGSASALLVQCAEKSGKGRAHRKNRL